MITLSEKEIMQSEIEKLLSSWVIDFMRKFEDILVTNSDNSEENPRFLELRPNSFYI